MYMHKILFLPQVMKVTERVHVGIHIHDHGQKSCVFHWLFSSVNRTKPLFKLYTQIQFILSSKNSNQKGDTLY